MQFGLHYLMSCPSSHSPEQIYRETLEQAQHADALGFESVWPVEHHFVRAASVMPCPMLLLAAIAARTRKLRLGTAIVQMPLNHPVRVAEEAATLDVLSGGRVELGVGRGGNAIHYRGLGVDQAQSRARFEESMGVLQRCLSEERFSFRGAFYDLEDVSLSPRPLQRPHPLLRVAANSPETAKWAGRAGLPIMFATNINPLPRLPQLMDVYETGRAEAGHAPATANDVSVLMPVLVGREQAEVRALMEPSIRYFAQLAMAVAEAGLAHCRSAEERAPLELLIERVRTLGYEQVAAVMGALGTPDDCIEKLQSVQRELKVARIITWFNFGGLVPHTAAMRSMELFASEVMPQLTRG